MKIGCPKEIKPQEFRVGLTPAAAAEAASRGHQVLVETGAGAGAGFTDEDYAKAGATIAPDAAAVFGEAELVIKVKEPQAAERAMLRKGQVLFTYLHLAPDPDQTRDLLESGVTAIAYETVTDARGGLPLLAPMSEVAGRLAPQVGSWALQKANGGRGVLMGGVPGVRPANVVIIGGGVVGAAAARVAVGMGANVTVMDRSVPRLSYLDDIFMGKLTTQFASGPATAEAITRADMVIGAVLIPGAAAPKLVTREQLGTMPQGRGAGGRGHRSGRLLRDLARHHPSGPDLRGGRDHPLLRREHARRGGAHLDAGAWQRDAAASSGAGGQGLAAGGDG